MSLSTRDTRRPDGSGRRMRARIALAGTLFVCSVAGWVLAFILDSPPYVSVWDSIWAVSFLAFPVVGVVLAIRRPSNPIGWMFVIGPGLMGHGVSQMEMGREPLGGNLFGVGLLVLLFSLLLFPDGRYPGRVWMWGHVLVLGGLGLEPILSPATDGGRTVAAALVLTVASLIHRVTRGDGATRRQLALPVLVGLVGFVGATVTGWLTESEWATIWIPVMTVGVPAAIAVAIFRYRLFEIDRVVSRTVGYLIIAVVVASVYAVPVLILPRALGERSDLVIAASTLAAAAVFNPVRRRIQRAVDRRFNRSNYDAEREVEALADRLRTGIAIGSITASIEETVSRTVQPVGASIWIREHS